MFWYVKALKLKQHTIRHVSKNRQRADVPIQLGETMNQPGKPDGHVFCIGWRHHYADALPADQTEGRLHLFHYVVDSGAIDDQTRCRGVGRLRFSEPLEGPSRFAVGEEPEHLKRDETTHHAKEKTSLWLEQAAKGPTYLGKVFDTIETREIGEGPIKRTFRLERGKALCGQHTKLRWVRKPLPGGELLGQLDHTG